MKQRGFTLVEALIALVLLSLGLLGACAMLLGSLVGAGCSSSGNNRAHGGRTPCPPPATSGNASRWIC